MLRCSFKTRDKQHLTRFIIENVVCSTSLTRTFSARSRNSHNAQANSNDGEARNKGVPSSSIPSNKILDSNRPTFLLTEDTTLLLDENLESPHNIKSQYYALKATGQLHRLSPQTLSSLISFFGTLSYLAALPLRTLLSEEDSYAFHPLAQRLYNESPSGMREHWAFVINVYKDKRSMGFDLSASDNFWLMRASLQDFKKTAGQKNVDENQVHRGLARARNYYFLVNASPMEWIVHKVYLEGLLNASIELAVEEVTIRLSKMLVRYGGLQPQLFPTIWRVLAAPTNLLSASTKSLMLDGLRGKLNKLHYDMSEAELAPGQNSRLSEPSGKPFDAVAVQKYLANILFLPSPNIHSKRNSHLHSIYPWAIFEARAALGAFRDGTYASIKEADEAAWNNLVLLSLMSPQARISKSLNLVGLSVERNMDGVDSQGQVLGWTVICALSALDTEVHRSHVRSPGMFPAASIKDIARTLWLLWRKEESWRAGAVMRSQELVSSAAASFMTLACHANDRPLADAIMRHTRAAVIFPAQIEKSPLAQVMLKNLAAHYAFLHIGKDHHEQILAHLVNVLQKAELVSDSQDAHQFTAVVACELLKIIARSDPLRAHRAYKCFSEFGMQIAEPALISLLNSLITSGRLEAAASSLLEEAQTMSKNSSQKVFDFLVNQVVRTRGYILNKRLTDAITSLVTQFSIIPTNGVDLNQLLFAYIRSEHLIEAMKIVKYLEATKSTDLLRSTFLAQFISSLVSHRHYSLLGKLLKRPWVQSPSLLSPLLRQTRFQYLQRLLSHSSEGITGKEFIAALPFSVYIWPRMQAHVPFHPRLAYLDRKILSLKLSTSLTKKEKLDDVSLERAVLMLLNVGRTASALKLIDRHTSTISTKLGNIILSATLFPRHFPHKHRILRHASLRLGQLIKTRAFVPDRVTVNIVMKALLRWNGLSSVTSLRSLFDQVILNGYPGLKEYYSTISAESQRMESGRNKVLFGDRVATVKKQFPLEIDGFPERISFARHIRPLYKMFVRALREKGDLEGSSSVQSLLEGKKEEIMNRLQMRSFGRRRARTRKNQQNSD